MTEATTPKGEQTRAAIINAAFHSITENGYHGTSMRQIADDAGIAVGGIYNHFSGKEDIFTAMIREYHPFTRALPALTTSEGEQTDELLQDAARRIVSEFETEPALLNLLYIELVELNGRHLPELVADFLPMLQEFVARITGADGQLRYEEPIIVIRSFLGMIFAYVFTGMLLSGTPAEAADTTTLDNFVDIYMHGILQ